ncbi:hypothetical protein [Ornithinibacillus contaminans]|uniref:hypothetical protein n=1 Tax=Ornithinibacillus contaminans TaxID=694055 RepID=UPI00064DCE2C|nr:hypothetical protein [Ornithinibacillus contaminans]
MVRSSEATAVIDTNASSSAFGWDFQSNAAILLALKNIKCLESLKVEGKIDDIELYLKDSKTIFVQAKSQEDPTSSTNTLTKLRDALKTLINATNQSKYEKIIYVSNIMNPLKDKELFYYFMGHGVLKYTYTELNNPAKGIIKKYIDNAAKKFNLSLSYLDYNKLEIWSFPFFGEDKETRYRIINEAVKTFLASADISEGIAQHLLDYWQNIFFQNASTKLVKLKKEDLIWPVVVLDSSISYYDSFFDNYDPGEIEEIVRKYNTFINKKSEQFEFVTKVVNDFTKFQKENHSLKRKESIGKFIETNWKSYDSLFKNNLLEPDIKEGVIKLVLTKILTNRFRIDSVKKAAGLL